MGHFSCFKCLPEKWRRAEHRNRKAGPQILFELLRRNLGVTNRGTLLLPAIKQIYLTIVTWQDETCPNIEKDPSCPLQAEDNLDIWVILDASSADATKCSGCWASMLSVVVNYLQRAVCVRDDVAGRRRSTTTVNLVPGFGIRTKTQSVDPVYTLELNPNGKTDVRSLFTSTLDILESPSIEYNAQRTRGTLDPVRTLRDKRLCLQRLASSRVPSVCRYAKHWTWSPRTSAVMGIAILSWSSRNTRQARKTYVESRWWQLRCNPRPR